MNKISYTNSNGITTTGNINQVKYRENSDVYKNVNAICIINPDDSEDYPYRKKFKLTITDGGGTKEEDIFFGNQLDQQLLAIYVPGKTTEQVIDDIIINQMRKQAEIAIQIADVIIFLTDIKQGVTAADKDISLMLKNSKNFKLP